MAEQFLIDLILTYDMMKHLQGRTMTHTMSFEDCISKIICEVEGMKLKAVTGDYDGMMEHMQRIDSIVFPNIVDV